MIRLTALVFLSGLFLPQDSARAQPPDDGRLPYGRQPIDYFGPATNDPVARLAARLEKGEARLEFREGAGYLRAVLDALGVPVASQMLVFAKNSVHARLISPANPRALYFNDAVYVGWVPGAPVLEISAVDPQKGAIFYTLRQEADPPAKFVREESCLLCHASVNALNVPGHLARSFLTDPQGKPTSGVSRITHDSPVAERWGGWYVTGDFGTNAHRGNLTTAAELDESALRPGGPGHVLALAKRFEVARYPAAHSDVVALLVHDHQLHLHNLLTRVGYEARLSRASRDGKPAVEGDRSLATSGLETTLWEEKLVRYLLFADAPPLDSPVLGTSGFEAWFPKQGPMDRQGRSLRQFDLETRVFRYRCSYLIYSPAFDALPELVRNRIFRRLWEVLNRETPPEPFDSLPRGERQAIVDILRETKSGLPEEWSAR